MYLIKGHIDDKEEEISNTFYMYDLLLREALQDEELANEQQR